MRKDKKRDFSGIGSSILGQSNSPENRPNSLAEIMGKEKTTEVQENKPESIPKKEKILDKVVKDGISIPLSDYSLIDDMILRCAKQGQKATKADVYRAALRQLDKTSDSILAKKIYEVRRRKKTHS